MVVRISFASSLLHVPVNTAFVLLSKAGLNETYGSIMVIIKMASSGLCTCVGVCLLLQSFVCFVCVSRCI